MNKTEAYTRASRHYLTDELPSNFDELDEQEIMDFIRDHRWEPLEEWEPHGIWEMIDSLAREFLEVSNQPTQKHMSNLKKSMEELNQAHAIFNLAPFVVTDQDNKKEYWGVSSIEEAMQTIMESPFSTATINIGNKAPSIKFN